MSNNCSEYRITAFTSILYTSSSNYTSSSDKDGSINSISLPPRTRTITATVLINTSVQKETPSIGLTIHNRAGNKNNATTMNSRAFSINLFFIIICFCKNKKSIRLWQANKCFLPKIGAEWGFEPLLRHFARLLLNQNFKLWKAHHCG